MPSYPKTTMVSIYLMMILKFENVTNLDLKIIPILERDSPLGINSAKTSPVKIKSYLDTKRD